MLRSPGTSLFLIVFIIACAAALTSCANRSPVSSVGYFDPNYATEIARARNIVAPLVRRGSGVSVAIGLDGELIWSEGFGYKSLAQDQEVSPTDQFRLYSLMKQVTSVLALQSVLRGEISFNTNARDLLPELPESYSAVTLQHLLTHTSGVRHYLHPAEAMFFNHCENARTALGRFINDPLVHQPGTQETYSTFGFMLASAMLEAASGMSFPTLVQQRIAEPAGLKTFTLETPADSTKALAFYDVDSQGQSHPSLPVDNSCKMGGGGFVASAEDLVRFHNAVLNASLVPAPALKQLLGERDALLAGGSGVGGQAVSVADLGSRISVVVLSNTSGLEQELALQRARDLLQQVFVPHNAQERVGG